MFHRVKEFIQRWLCALKLSIKINNYIDDIIKLTYNRKCKWSRNKYHYLSTLPVQMEKDTKISLFITEEPLVGTITIYTSLTTECYPLPLDRVKDILRSVDFYFKRELNR